MINKQNNGTMKIEKLISEYEDKVERIDEALNEILALTRKARHGDESIDVEDLREERINANSRRQIYIQFISDLDSLRD